MTDQQYREYLKSDEWKMIAARRMQIDGMSGTGTAHIERGHDGGNGGI